ncbi:MULTISPECIES: alpha/beta hydrolase [unclassified Sphingopyxis]|uniref:alpha/beta hydrolase n=1 Tax=unclassified Sphingopyxis TaxID=2614943 RepID=UPI0028569D97|nr:MULTISPECIES: alpha/beta hydrolase [unclassified Sphingopyxis]MDR7061093.1 acetyl esterase/lipase [Sphingopyxis sp. BE235]MDR7181550.1 acetyl esterase/lipase [Sphingopyxis sp. BE249]
MKVMTMRLSAAIAGALAIVAIPACAWEVIRLSSDPVPATSKEVRETGPFGTIVRNVSDATLTPYVAEKPNGTAVIVAPGGGFHMLSIDNEGEAVAKWLNSQGVTAFVLKYRLLETGADFPLQMMRYLANLPSLRTAVEPLRPLATADGENAVKWVRKNAARYSIKPNRVGLMGFSAGGAVTVWTLAANKPASRPDFAIAIYPGLLPDAIAVPKKAPPLFVAAAKDDKLAYTDSVRLAAAWKSAGANSTIVTYESGGHGFGMKKSGKPSDAWTDAMATWMRGQGLVGK